MMIGRFCYKLGLLFCSFFPAALRADVIVLGFGDRDSFPENEPSLVVPLGNYYNGGNGGSYGVSFDQMDHDVAARFLMAEHYPNPQNMPGAPAVAGLMGGYKVTMTVAGGFQNSIGFWYNAPNYTTQIKLYDGQGGRIENLYDAYGREIQPETPRTPGGDNNHWNWFTLGFEGTAYKVVFEVDGTQTWFRPEILIDNLTLGAPVAAPEPSALLAGGVALAGFAGFLASKRRWRTAQGSASGQVRQTAGTLPL